VTASRCDLPGLSRTARSHLRWNASPGGSS